MNHQPEIAIVEANTLTSLGLKTILERMIPMAVIRTFPGFGELMDDTQFSKEYGVGVLSLKAGDFPTGGSSGALTSVERVLIAGVGAY